MKIDTYASGFVLVILSGLVANVGLLTMRRLLPSSVLTACHDVGGYLLSIVGTMYAVILGLVVVDAMVKFENARQTTERESNAVADIILLANQLPREKRTQVQRLALDYAARVVDDEWPILDEGRYSPEARRAAIDLIDAVSVFDPETEREKAVYGAELTAVTELWNNRRGRTATAEHGIPRLEWVVLIAGGVMTVAFTYFFTLDHLPIQVVMTTMVSTIITLNLYLILMFGYPFSGELKVDCHGFKVGQAIIDHQASRAPHSAGH